MKKILVVTGNRAEYGLLRWVIDGISKSNLLELQLCVTGMHLSPEFGLTYQEIEKDGYKINSKVEISYQHPNNEIIKNELHRLNRMFN